MSKCKRSAVWTSRLLSLLDVAPFIYYMLVLLDRCSTYIWYRIISVSILPISSGQILSIVPSGSNTWYHIHSISAGTSHHY